MQKKDATAIDAIVTDTTDLRANLASLADVVRAQNEAIGKLADAALASRTRTARRTIAPATVSEADRACAAGGFRRGYRAQMLRDLLARGPGEYALSAIAPVSLGYPARSAIPVAQAIARRLSRTPTVGYTLIVDTDEADAGKTELVFAVRTAADTVETSPETEKDADPE